MSEPPMPDAVFSRVTEEVRGTVRRVIMDCLAATSGQPEAAQAVILGGVAGAVEAFVAAASETVTRDRLKEALRDVVTDFVDQAKDQLVGGPIQ
jgi:hypothetical protein